MLGICFFIQGGEYTREPAWEGEKGVVHQNLTPAQRHVLSPAKQWNLQIQHAGSGRTALRWTDSNTGKTAVMALHPHEFIRRWLLHVLPKGLARVRHYGYLAAAGKHRLRVRALLGELGEPAPKLPEALPFTCQCCGEALTFLREIAPIRLLRAPPLIRT
jgi:hypothetical protein